jgi:hypothetical protein
MSKDDLETKLAEARTRTIAAYYADRSNETAHDVWDAAAAIAREEVARRDAQFEFEAAGFVRRLAEKDAEIARLESYIARLPSPSCPGRRGSTSISKSPQGDGRARNVARDRDYMVG